MMRNKGLPACAGLLFLLVASALAADDNPLAHDAKMAKAGEFEFRINCAFCHGLGARGGGRGPDLTRARKRHGTSDDEIFHNISTGIPGTAMPGNGSNGQGVSMTDDEIWQLVAYIRSVEVKAPTTPAGDAALGKALFYGDANCSGCHMIEGKGGRLGPDLTSVAGARTLEALVRSVREPSQRLAQGLIEPTKEFAQEYETVTVVTAEGKEIRGVALNEDSFSIQLMDESEKLHLLEKDKLKSFSKTRNSMMPKYNESLLSDKDLQDILAYLVSVAK